jgi:ornithine carbamoyltransferase
VLPTIAHARDFNGQDLLTLSNLTPTAVLELFATARRMKADLNAYRSTLDNLAVALLFEKPSLRTKMSFEVGIAKLGGHPIFMDHGSQRLGARESVRDYGKNLERWVDCIVARVYSQQVLEEMADAAKCPVINALSDRFHPCQGLADLFTLYERAGGDPARLRQTKLLYMGDGNNVCHSLMLGGTAAGMHVAVASPAGFEPDATLVARARELAAQSGGSIVVTPDPAEAAAGVDAIYTDVHESMGQPDDPHKRVALTPYKVTTALMAEARPTAVFMHCLPMQRDVEVEAAVADGPQSIVFEQAANRLHMHKAVLLLTMG